MFQVKPLSEAQIRQYHDDGYLFVGKAMDDRQLADLRHEEARFRVQEQARHSGELTLFINQLYNHSEIVREVCMRGPHMGYIKQLVGPNISFWWDQYVTKFPDGNSGKSEFPWHQDNGYTSIVPGTNVTIWCALDDVDEKNGCVWVMPRSHKKGLLPHGKANENSWHLHVAVEGDGIPARLKAGEAIIFSALTLHRSKLNYSDKPRRAFFMEYVDSAATHGRDGDPKPVATTFGSWMVAGEIPRP